MNNDGAINEIAAFATVAICIMTFISFGITTGMWEAPFWISDIDADGQWGEDIIVTYDDGTTESVKGISNNYWSTMSIESDGSKPISSLQYCINAKIPTSDSFDTLGYECMISIFQDDIDFYQDTYATVHFVDVKADEWTRIVTVPLCVECVSGGLNNGVYTVSFENIGTIGDIDVPEGRSIDISVDDGIVTFLV